MIENDKQLEQSNDALRNLENALYALRKRFIPDNVELFGAMSQDYLKDINRIRGEIDTYIGAELVKESAAPLWIVLEDPRIKEGEIASSILEKWLGKFRSVVSTNANLTQKKEGKLTDRNKNWLAKMCDFEILQFAPGSFKIGMRLPELKQQELFEDVQKESQKVAQEALQQILALALWATSDGDLKGLDKWGKTPEEKLSLIRQILRLVPQKNDDITSLRLEGAILPQPKPIRLASDIRLKISKLIGSLTKEEVETHQGILRELDIDRRHIILRKRPNKLPDLACHFNTDIEQEVIGALNKKVEVSGTTKTGKTSRLKIFSISILK